MRSFARICTLYILYLCLQGAAFASPVVIHQGVQAKLFYSALEKLDNYEVITGKIIEEEDAEEFFSNSFRPQSMENIEGSISRAVYDYPSDIASVAVYQAILKSLEKNKFTKLFSCSEDACGDPSGWKLVLGKYALGSEDTQYYAAYKKAADNNGRTIHITAYVNESDSRPRLIIDRIYSTTGDSFSLPINMANNVEPEEKQPGGMQLDHGKIFSAENSAKQITDASNEHSPITNDKK